MGKIEGGVSPPLTLYEIRRKAVLRRAGTSVVPAPQAYGSQLKPHRLFYHAQGNRQCSGSSLNIRPESIPHFSKFCLPGSKRTCKVCPCVSWAISDCSA